MGLADSELRDAGAVRSARRSMQGTDDRREDSSSQLDQYLGERERAVEQCANEREGGPARFLWYARRAWEAILYAYWIADGKPAAALEGILKEPKDAPENVILEGRLLEPKKGSLRLVREAGNLGAHARVDLKAQGWQRAARQRSPP